MQDLNDKLLPIDNSGLVQHAARSVKWTTLSSLLPRMITPISTMILAGLLTPSDFGTVAISTLIITLAQVIVGLGLGQTIIQFRKNVVEAASTAFILNLLFAIFLYILLWVIAPLLANFYQNPILITVIRVASISLVLYALGSIPTSLLQRELQFRQLFWVNTLPVLCNVIVSLLLAFLGAGIWALVIGPLAGAIVGTSSACLLSKWRPSFRIERSILRSLFTFSVWVVLSSIFSWLFLQGDNAIASLFFGQTELGIYTLGFNISYLLPGMITSPLSAVAYPAFCVLQDNPKEVGNRLLQLQSLTISILLPVCAGVSVIAVPLVSLLYGDKWQGLGQVIQLLSLMSGISSFWSLNSDAYRAIGRPDIWPKLSAITLLLLLPLLYFTAHYGLIPFTIGRSCGQLIYVLLNILVMNYSLRFSFRDQLVIFKTPLTCVLVMYFISFFLIKILMPFTGMIGWLKLISVIVIAIIIYLSLFWLLDKGLWNKIKNAGFQILSRS